MIQIFLGLSRRLASYGLSQKADGTQDMGYFSCPRWERTIMVVWDGGHHISPPGSERASTYQPISSHFSLLIPLYSNIRGKVAPCMQWPNLFQPAWGIGFSLLVLGNNGVLRALHVSGALRIKKKDWTNTKVERPSQSLARLTGVSIPQYNMNIRTGVLYNVQATSQRIKKNEEIGK